MGTGNSREDTQGEGEGGVTKEEELQNATDEVEAQRTTDNNSGFLSRAFQRFTGSDEGFVQYFTKDIKNEAIYGLIRDIIINSGIDDLKSKVVGRSNTSNEENRKHIVKTFLELIPIYFNNILEKEETKGNIKILSDYILTNQETKENFEKLIEYIALQQLGKEKIKEYIKFQLNDKETLNEYLKYQLEEGDIDKFKNDLLQEGEDKIKKYIKSQLNDKETLDEYLKYQLGGKTLDEYLKSQLGDETTINGYVQKLLGGSKDLNEFMNKKDLLKKLITKETLQNLIQLNDENIDLNEKSWENLLDIYIKQKIKEETNEAKGLIHYIKEWLPIIVSMIIILIMIVSIHLIIKYKDDFKVIFKKKQKGSRNQRSRRRRKYR